MYKRIAILLLIILLFGSSISYAELAAGRASDETVFEVALEDLKQYRDVQSVREAEEMFGQIMSGYNSSSMFKMYAGVIGNILEENFADAELVLGRLAERGSFAKLLKEYGLPSCENLVRYVKARTAEAAGDYAAASEIYADLDVFDSIERLISLDVQHEETQAPRYAEAEAEFAAGHYAAAAEIWRELGDYRDSADRMAEAVELGATPTPSPTPSPSPEPTPVPRSAWPILNNDFFSDYYTDYYRNGSFSGKDAVVSNSNYRRDKITTITILNNLSDASTNAWDISEVGNGSILAWVEPNGSYYDLFIAGKGGVHAPENSNHLFAGYKRLTAIYFNECFDTSKVTNMNGMFSGCNSLQNIDLSSFDTSNVTEMGMMFSDCTNITNLNLSNFDTSKVTNMNGMFSGCSSLQNLDLSSFDTSNVTEMGMMFSDCTNITDFDLSNFDTSKVTNMNGMFIGCSSLQNVDLSNFDTSSVTDMSFMFDGCSSLQNLDLLSFDTSNVTNMTVMFSGCSSLKYLRTSSSFVIRDDTLTGWMFSDDCPIQSIN